MRRVPRDPIAGSDQVLEWRGVIYRSSYDRAACQAPEWTCDHRHESPHEADDCARQHLHAQQDRAPVQKSRRYGKPAGSVAWWEHDEAWQAYHARHRDQSAHRIAERGGFGYGELVEFLGHEPTTWEENG